MRIVSLAVLLGCVVSGPAAISAQDTPTPNTAFVDGQVVNAISLDPIGSVKLLLAPANGAGKPFSLETDADGRFIFQDLAGGRYLLFAEAPGFARQAYKARGNPLSGAVLLVSSGQEIADLVFKLTPAAVISGKVVDNAGNPVAKAAVMALQPVYQRGKKQYVPMAATQSDAAGASGLPIWRPENICSQQHTEATRKSRESTPAPAPAGAPERSYTTTFYPNSPNITAAAAVTVTAGTEAADQDIHMAKVNTYHVVGKVADTEKSATAVVWLTPKGSGISALATRVPAAVQADGGFEFDAVEPGSYVLNQAEKDGITTSGPIGGGHGCRPRMSTGWFFRPPAEPNYTAM